MAQNGGAAACVRAFVCVCVSGGAKSLRHVDVLHVPHAVVQAQRAVLRDVEHPHPRLRDLERLHVCVCMYVCSRRTLRASGGVPSRCTGRSTHRGTREYPVSTNEYPCEYYVVGRAGYYRLVVLAVAPVLIIGERRRAIAQV